MKKLHFVVLLAACCTVLSACKKDSSDRGVTELSLRISHTVDGAALMPDTLMYTTEAGFDYSVQRMQYYLSGIALILPDSSLKYIDSYAYVDAFDTSTCRIYHSKIAEGSYIGLAFNVGLDSMHNVWDSLSATTANINMQWPLLMGGGYHFMKFEGYFSDSDTTYGFAMHLGTNACLERVRLYKTFTLPKGEPVQLNLGVNLNEWFRTPYTFDFNDDGNYIMGNAAAMKKVAENGKNAFSL